ncbi:MAG: hypothetical protein KAQ96_00450, partial [Thermoplasmata archaeon]|nr:hypothetical protein [Thermoplasmata archaeon]
NRLFVFTANYEGWMGNHTQWDWRVRETRSTLRHSVTPYLVGGSQRLTGASIEFDRDFEENLVFHDILTPDLTVEGPGTNHVQNYDNLTIHGKCLDAHSGPKVVQISFDPEPSWDKKFWSNASGTHQWNFYMDPAPDAVLTIFVRAFDWANYPNGMHANITITNVTVDTQAPNLTLIQPTPNIITNQSQLTVLGTTDPDVVSLTLNGEALDAYGGTFNKAIQLNEGMNNIIIIATDYAGNIANATRQIILDSIQPIMVVKHPINELYTNEITVQMGGISDREGVTMTIDGEPVPVQSDGTWTHTVSLFNGWNFILIDAVDIALNHRVVTHKIFYDPDPPRINVFEPTENAVINSSVFNIMGSTDPDVLNAQIRVNGIWIGLENSAFNTEFTLLVEGATELEFYAKDWAGNERTIYVPIVIDTTAPTIDDLLPIDGEIVKEHVINVTGSTEEDATVYVNGRYVSLVGGDFVEQINLDEGDNYINILVNDVAKNTRAIHRLVVLDTMPPDVFVDTLVGDSLKTDANFLTIMGQTEPTAILFIEYGRLNDPAPPVREEIPVDENGDFSYPVIVGKNKTTNVTLFSTDYAGNTDVEVFIIKREIKEEPTYFEDHPEVLYGIIIVVAAIVVAFFAVKMGLARTYDRRLKVMGYGTQVQPPPDQAPPHPPPDQAPPHPPPGERPRGPPGAPPKPPSDTPKAPPRPPTEAEGGTEPAPRPPRDDE